MTTRRLGQIDLDTGEVIEDGQLVYQPAKKTNGFQTGGWVAMAQDPLTKLAKANLGGEALNVFLHLCGRLDFENWINVSQAELAHQLDMQPSHFNRALAKLIAEGVVLKGPSVGHRKTYRLDPAYGWKGSAKNHRAELNARTKAAHLTVHNGGKQ